RRPFSAATLARPAFSRLVAFRLLRTCHRQTEPGPWDHRVFDFVRAIETNREMSCINCSSCGYPHLDLADFADTPHRKHFCGNCGRDSTWSKEPIISTPLKPLHDAFAKTLKYETPDRNLDLDSYAGCDFAVWASTPAIVWTAARPQEFGIHVHVHNGQGRIVDDTYNTVVYHGKPLERSALIASMIARTIV
uniref:hypothetical protein n=1 Tax=Sphingomonas sp. TaxID=28214 RepID=UPI0025EB8924